jgi:hypothetical protein
MKQFLSVKLDIKGISRAKLDADPELWEQIEQDMTGRIDGESYYVEDEDGKEYELIIEVDSIDRP